MQPSAGVVVQSVFSSTRFYPRYWVRYPCLMDQHDFSSSHLQRRVLQCPDEIDVFVTRCTPFAKTPTKHHPFDSGIELYSAHNYFIPPNSIGFVKTDLLVDIPVGAAGQLLPKPELPLRNQIDVFPEIIPCSNKNRIVIRVLNFSRQPFQILRGQKMCQLVIQKVFKTNIKEEAITF